jgi:hypothetical protein
VFLDLRDEAKSYPRDRLDEGLLGTAVADGAAGRIDAARKRRFRYDPPFPNSVEDIVLRNDTVTIADQKEKQVENLRSNIYQCSTAAQLPPVRID